VSAVLLGKTNGSVSLLNFAGTNGQGYAKQIAWNTSTGLLTQAGAPDELLTIQNIQPESPPVASSVVLAGARRWGSRLTGSYPTVTSTAIPKAPRSIALSVRRTTTSRRLATTLSWSRRG